jgi:hypothetical protein
MGSTHSDFNRAQWELEFKGEAPKVYGNELYVPKENAEIYIYFADQMFAKFKGKLARAIVPINGEITYFTGAKHKIGDDVRWEGLVNMGMVKQYAKGINYIRGEGNNTVKSVSDEDIDIELAFNSPPAKAKESSVDALIFSFGVVGASNEVVMNYDIKPKRKGVFVAPEYVVTLKVEFRFQETYSTGIWGVGQNRRIFQDVDIVIKKKDKYRASGSVRMTELETYMSALGFQKALSGLEEPRVSIVDIIAN